MRKISFGGRQMMWKVFWVGNMHQGKPSGFKEIYFKESLKSECWSRGTVSTCSAQCSFSPRIPVLAAASTGSCKWSEEFHQFYNNHPSYLSCSKADVSLLYIRTRKQPFSLKNHYPHSSFLLKNSFNNIYVLHYLSLVFKDTDFYKKHG